MVMGSQGDATSSSAAALLRRLLAEEDDYRRRWQHYVRRNSPGPLHQGAISQVLADYLLGLPTTWRGGVASPAFPSGCPWWAWWRWPRPGGVPIPS